MNVFRLKDIILQKNTITAVLDEDVGAEIQRIMRTQSQEMECKLLIVPRSAVPANEMREMAGFEPLPHSQDLCLDVGGYHVTVRHRK